MQQKYVRNEESMEEIIGTKIQNGKSQNESVDVSLAVQNSIQSQIQEQSIRGNKGSRKVQMIRKGSKTFRKRV